MRSVLFFTLLILIFTMPLITVAAPDEVPYEAVVTMEITGMT
jgi:hypothetical protein